MEILPRRYYPGLRVEKTNCVITKVIDSSVFHNTDLKGYGCIAEEKMSLWPCRFSPKETRLPLQMVTVLVRTSRDGKNSFGHHHMHALVPID